MSAKAKRHKDKVAGLGCVLCAMLGQPQETRTHVHHMRTGQGMAQRASDFLAIALCADCHQGPQGLHGDRTLLKIARTDEIGLLAATIEALA